LLISSIHVVIQVKKKKRKMNKQRILFISGIVLIFVFGIFCGIYLASTSRTLKIIEQTDIRNNCIDIRRSLFYLKLLEKEDFKGLKESFEWDIDEAILALNQYQDEKKTFSKFDEYALKTLLMTKEYRRINSRETKNKTVDTIIRDAVLESPYFSSAPFKPGREASKF